MLVPSEFGGPISPETCQLEPGSPNVSPTASSNSAFETQSPTSLLEIPTPLNKPIASSPLIFNGSSSTSDKTISAILVIPSSDAALAIITVDPDATVPYKRTKVL